jgi:hypothetical protein
MFKNLFGKKANIHIDDDNSLKSSSIGEGEVSPIKDKPDENIVENDVANTGFSFFRKAEIYIEPEVYLK